MSENTDTTIDRLRIRIMAYMQRHQLSRRQMAARAGITEIVLRQLHKPTWNPRAENLRRLEMAMRAPLGNGANQARLSA